MDVLKNDSSNVQCNKVMTVYLTVPEVAKMLKVSKSYIYDTIARGQLKTIRLSERRIRIPEESLREFIKTDVKGVQSEIAQSISRIKGKIK
jgi:excisionase family DNA binding protein